MLNTKLKTILLRLTFILVANTNAFASSTNEVDADYNWTRTFILKDGKNTISHTPDYVGVGTSMRLGALKSTVGSSLNGIKIEGEDLFISKKMTYADFVKGLVAANLYVDEPGNWYEEFDCIEEMTIIHTKDAVILKQGEVTRVLKFLTLEGNSNYTLMEPMAYDVFIGILNAAGYYKPAK